VCVLYLSIITNGQGSVLLNVDAHELLIALINDISEPISQLFQGQQMASTVKCSSCDRTTIKPDDTQDISLHIEEDASLHSGTTKRVSTPLLCMQYVGCCVCWW